MVPQQKTLLLIDDQLIFSKIITNMITRCTPHRVIYQADGSHILDVIRENRPHLLILDYELPGMNGIELYDLVHATSGLETLPAIMMSADLPQREIAQRNIPGLSKPCPMQDFLYAVEMALLLPVGP